jgi:anti-sigma regulatory factor (Ser/Thr protein kinase)/ActR/RegA family two-component response regulator
LKILSDNAELKQAGQYTLALLHKDRRSGPALRNRLQEGNYHVKLFRSIGRMISWLERNPVQTVLVELADENHSPRNIARIREKYPLLPILALADGADSECLKNSIKNGANHFVLDPANSDSLIGTIERLITFRMEYIRYAQVVPYIKTRLETSLPSQLELLGGVVFFLTEEMFKHGIISLNQINVKVALIEALTNAMEHGNGLKREKKVHIQADYDHDKAVIHVVDEGKGFDFETLQDPTHEENIYRPRGRGIFMMRQFMDDVTFHAPGNHVTLVKKRSAENMLLRPYPWERRTI